MGFKKLVVQSILWRGLYFFSVLLLNILIARYLGASGSGWIYYVTNFFSLILLVAGLSFESAMTYYGSRKEIAYEKLSVLSATWSLFISFVILLLVYFYYSDPEEEITRKIFVFITITYTTGVLLTNYYCALFYAKQDFFTPNLVLCITNFALILFFPLTDMFGNHDFLNRFMQVYFITFLAQGILLALTFMWKYNRPSSVQFPSWKEIAVLFRYAMYALLTNVVFFLLYRIDYWFVKNTCRICADTDLGNYIQVSKLGQIFLVLPAIIASAVFPQTASGQQARMNAGIQVLSRILLVMYVVIVATLLAVGEWLFPWLYGKSFDHMYAPFLLLSPGIISLSIVSFLAAYNSGKNKVITNLKGSVIALLIIIAGDALFIPKYGIEAAAAVSSVGYISYLFFALYIFAKEYNARVADFFIFRKSDIGVVKRLFQKTAAE